MSKRCLVAICYDVEDDGRRAKVAAILERYGVRRQKSVFEAYLSDTSLDKLVRQLVSVLDKNRDSLRLYKICNSCVRKIWVVCGEPVLADKSCEVVA
jgi:CRISPR-associated protein Cas2